MEPDGIKSVPFQVKKAGEPDGLEEGQFEGYASVFGNVDSYGDVVEKGAFAKSLAEWAAKGDPIPLLWGHDFRDPFSNIGAIVSAEEDDHGLKVRGSFDLDNPKAAQVYRLSKGRRVTGMSFAYDVREAEEKDDGYHLLELHIFEASIVPVGANPLAGVESVKSGAAMLADSVKAGRTISAKNESALRAARDSIDSVLASLDAQDGKAATAADDQEQQASGTAETKTDASDEEPTEAKSPASVDESMPSPSVSTLAAQAKIYALSGAGRGAS